MVLDWQTCQCCPTSEAAGHKGTCPQIFRLNREPHLTVRCIRLRTGCHPTSEGSADCLCEPCANRCSLGTPRLRRSFWLLFTIWKGFILTLTVKEVFVESDHKPLEVIFKKPLHRTPKRLQRMLMRVQLYNVSLGYKKGSTMYLADTLSRAY